MSSEGQQGRPPHVIRLRGPWQAAADQAPPARVKLPCTWADAFGAGADTATLSRRFNRPSSLAGTDTVLLRLGTEHTLLAAQLNAAPLELCDAIVEVTALLESSNLLTVSLRQGSAAAPLLDAQLEIVSR